MEEKSNGFFDANPKMLFVFGLVCGIAVTLIIGGAWPDFDSLGDDSDDDIVVVDAGSDLPDEEPAVLATVTEDDHIRGDINNAKVVIIEYSDFECPYCSNHHPTLVDVSETYGDDVAWAYRHFPLSFHAEAVPSALASECAADQDMFWDYADALYENQSELGDDLYVELATDLGLDVSQFSDCYESEKYMDDIQEDLDSGAAAGVTGTPGNFVNGIAVSGAQPASVFEGLIDQILAE